VLDGSQDAAHVQLLTEPVQLGSALWLPMDQSAPEKSLLKVTVETQLRQLDKVTYETMFGYKFSTETPGVSFQPEALAIRVQSRAAREGLATVGFKDGVMPLFKPEGGFSFKTHVSGPAEVENARLGFFDKAGLLLGSTFLPVVSKR
jgi:hypothetical protein